MSRRDAYRKLVLHRDKRVAAPFGVKQLSFDRLELALLTVIDARWGSVSSEGTAEP